MNIFETKYTFLNQNAEFSTFFVTLPSLPIAAAPESAPRTGRQFFAFGDAAVGLASGSVAGYPASTQPLTVMPAGTQQLGLLPSSPFAAALCFSSTGQ